MFRANARWVSMLLLMLLGCATAQAEEKLLGTRPPEWQLTDWLNSPPLQFQDLKGKVVLVRWWTGSGCPFCAATAPALNEFHKTYRDQGLVVIGVYHHKVETPLRVETVKATAGKFGFEFPVAIDADWQTLKQWWLNDGKKKWTSVSFLLDRQGVIRHIHPGGQYVKGENAYDAMKAKIEELVREK